MQDRDALPLAVLQQAHRAKGRLLVEDDLVADRTAASGSLSRAAISATGRSWRFWGRPPIRGWAQVGMHVVVDRHVLAPGAGLLHQSQVGRGIAGRAVLGRVVRDLDRQAGLAADLDRFGDGFQDGLALAADVRGIQPTVAGYDAGQGDDLLGAGKAAGRIHQPGGQPKGPGLHGLGQQSSMCCLFAGDGGALLQAHDGDAQRTVPDQRCDVDSQSIRFQGAR